MKDLIRTLLREGLTSCPHIKITQEIEQFVRNFGSDEELLRSGGIPMEMLDRAAHGFSEDDIKQIHPSKLRVRWDGDLDNVNWEVEESGLTPVEYSKQIDLSEPIEVDYWKDKEEGYELGFYIQDGHHRYYAAKVLDKMLNVELTIKENPISLLGRGLSYDDFHRCIFKQVKK